MVNAQNNPLLEDFNTPHQTAPFNQIKNEHSFRLFRNRLNRAKPKLRQLLKIRRCQHLTTQLLLSTVQESY
jgi:peptidyl-dipeptidase Dcp